MLIGNKSFNQFIEDPNDTDAMMMRLCLSDEISTSMEEVLDGFLSPVRYAHLVMKKHYALFEERFFSDMILDHSIPQELIRSLTYDRLVTMAITLRAIAIRPNDLHNVYQSISGARLFLLCLEKKGIIESQYSGLCEFTPHAEVYLGRNHSNFHGREISLLIDMISHISQIDFDDWFLYDTNWQYVLFDKFKNLKIIRQFFHVALASYSVPDYAVRTIFDVKRTLIYDFMEEFISLRQSKDTHTGDLLNFLSRLSLYFDNINNNQFFSVMYNSSFKNFEHIHRQGYGQATPKPPTVSVKINHS